jgi:hypothetical protein
MLSASTVPLRICRVFGVSAPAQVFGARVGRVVVVMQHQRAVRSRAVPRHGHHRVQVHLPAGRGNVEPPHEHVAAEAEGGNVALGDVAAQRRVGAAALCGGSGEVDAVVQDERRGRCTSD